MVDVLRVNDVLAAVAAHSDWQFAIGLRVRFANPTLLYQTYPEAWVRAYAEQAMLFLDPTVRWGLQNHGACRWSELRADDPAGILLKAAEHDLRYGVVVSVGEAHARTMGFFCRPDRELSDGEIAFALDRVQVLHDLTDGLAGATEEEMDDLRALNPGLR